MVLKVGFTYDSKNEYPENTDDIPDKYAEFDSEETIQHIESALKSGGYEVIRIGHARNLLDRIHSGEKWDIIFNICEGLGGRNRESQVPAILDLFNIPYSGSDALTMGLTLDKVMAKKIIEYHKLSTPKFLCINSMAELTPENLTLKFPLIIKLLHEGTSKGLSKESLVQNFKQLKERVDWTMETFKQPVLIEEFITGYEFTVAVVGNDPPEILPPVQISIYGKMDVGEDFYIRSMVESSDAIKYICPAKIDKKLEKKICDFTSKAYKILGCRDFGRFDFRVDYNNNPYFIECNPLPNLGMLDVFPLVAKATGRTYEQLICLILESALIGVRP